MKRPAPFIALWNRARVERNDLRGQLADALKREDELKQEVAVQKLRAARWRRKALEMAPKIGPRAMDVCLMAVQSEELADSPEIAEEHRNAFPTLPRSLP